MKKKRELGRELAEMAFAASSWGELIVLFSMKVATYSFSLALSLSLYVVSGGYAKVNA